MEKKQILMLATVGVAGMLLGAGLSTQAADTEAKGSSGPEALWTGGCPNKPGREMHQKLTEATTYDEFIKNLPEDAPMRDKITADNFGKFQEMHKLMQEGKRDEAKKIADELGLKPPAGFRHHRMMHS